MQRFPYLRGFRIGSALEEEYLYDIPAILFKQWIVDFSKEQLPHIYGLLDLYREKKNIVIFKSRKDSDDYLQIASKKAKEA